MVRGTSSSEDGGRWKAEMGYVPELNPTAA